MSASFAGLVGFGLGFAFGLSVKLLRPLNRQGERPHKLPRRDDVATQVRNSDFTGRTFAAGNSFDNGAGQLSMNYSLNRIKEGDVLEVNQGGGRGAFFSGQNLNSIRAGINAATLNGASQIRKDDEDEAPTSLQAGEGEG